MKPYEWRVSRTILGKPQDVRPLVPRPGGRLLKFKLKQKQIESIFDDKATANTLKEIEVFDLTPLDNIYFLRWLFEIGAIDYANVDIETEEPQEDDCDCGEDDCDCGEDGCDSGYDELNYSNNRLSDETLPVFEAKFHPPTIIPVIIGGESILKNMKKKRFNF